MSFQKGGSLQGLLVVTSMAPGTHDIPGWEALPKAKEKPERVRQESPEVPLCPDSWTWPRISCNSMAFSVLCLRCSAKKEELTS